MIITEILGGLGNQMFQYAAGRALALRLGQPLRLDISGFTSYDLDRAFELDHVFACDVSLATSDDLRSVLGWQYSGWMRRLLRKPLLAPVRCKRFVVEPHFPYWTGWRELSGNCYLAGFWQTEKYFAEIAQTLRAEFAFKPALSQRNAALAQLIQQVNAISLHVRRGDYVQDQRTYRTHGLCPISYYQAAIRHMVGQIERPHFFIFSDDVAWVRQHLHIDFPCTYVDHNQSKESFNDMRLMSMCRHHILANSSFSWWGAWLNARADKIVLAPQRWFANATDTRDLLPQGWLALAEDAA